jgi:hypothetical protein
VLPQPPARPRTFLFQSDVLSPNAYWLNLANGLTTVNKLPIRQPNLPCFPKGHSSKKVAKVNRPRRGQFSVPIGVARSGIFSEPIISER